MTDPTPAPNDSREQFVHNCDDLLRVISQYVDGEIEPGLCADFEKYMGRCNPCKVVVDNITRTIRLYREDDVYEMPLDCRKRLHDCLRKKWRETRGG